MIIGMFSDWVRNGFLWIKSSKTKTDRVSVPEGWQRCSRHVFAVFVRSCGIHFILPLPPFGLIRTLFEQTFTPPPVHSLFLSSADIGWHDLDPENTARYLCRRHTRTMLLYHLHTCTIRRAVYIYDTGYNIFVPPGPGEIRTRKKGACRNGRVVGGRARGRKHSPKTPSYEGGGGGGGVYRRTWGIRAKRDRGRLCTRVLCAKALKDITIKNNVPHKSV